MSGSVSSGDIRTSNFLDALAHPTVVNPLAAYSSAADAANKVWGIRKWQAEQAAGEAQQAGVDASGIYQPNTAAAALKAAGPGAALAAGQTLESSQRLGSAQTDQAAKTSALFATTVAPLINLPDSQIHQGVLDAAQRLIAAGAPAAQVHAGLLNMSTDPATLRQQLEMIRQSHLPPDQQQQNIYTRPGQVDTGSTYQPTATEVRTGVTRPVGAGIGKDLTPGEGAAIVTIGTDANGKEIRGTAQQAKNLAEGRALNDNGPASVGGLPASLRNPKAAPAVVPPAPASAQPSASVEAVPGGGFKVGLGPAEIEAQKAQAAQNVAGFQTISDQAVQSRNRTAILGNMLGDTAKFSTGPLASKIETFRAIANRIGLNVNTEGLSAQESFNKLAAQLANAQGAGSDARLNTNVAANPHQELSPAGVDLMVRQLQGNEDYLQARAKIAQSSGESNIKNFEAKIGTNLDPRAFQFDRMTPPQRQEYVKGLSPADRAAVQRSYNWAHGQGLVGN